MAQKYSQVIEKLGKNRVKQNEPLAKHTTFKIGGPADLFYEVKTTKELVEAIELARKLKVPYFILGGGSNILVNDKGFRGLIVKVQNTKIDIQGRKITAGAGVLLSRAVKTAAENSLSGLEFAAGVPGTVGGGVFGNAGAWGQSLSERILRVKILNKKNQVEWLNIQDCQFRYRGSRFKTSGEIVLEVEFGFEKGEQSEIEREMKINLEKRKKDPTGPSAGCIFINPKPVSAGRLIDECGLKGRKTGDAQISPKHANFIVNLGKAKASDVIQLIKLVKRKVKEKFGIELEEEIDLVGFDEL